MLFDRHPEPLFLFDRGTLRFLDVNEAAEEFYGWTRAEFLEMSLEDIRPADERAAFRAVVAHPHEGHGPRGTWTHLTKDGSRVGVEIVTQDVDVEGRPCRLVAVRDVTAREHALEALRESEERYRLLADHATDMISVHDPDGIYRYASPACRDLLGYEPAELTGRSAYTLFHPEDLEIIRASHEGILERSETSAVAYRIRRKDGRYVWFETTSRTIRDPETGEVRHIITVSRDVTVRKEAELERARFARELEVKNAELERALAEVKRLGGLLPICASCKSIRNDEGYWEEVETYVRNRSEASFSHGICPACMASLYGDLDEEPDDEDPAPPR
ncbi:MAG: PAS domain-containing protein [Myxococcota bacterium]